MATEAPNEPTIASASTTESIATIPCAICRRQFSRYACPRCNIPYCSLVCFRAEGHADCSESFYRKEVELDVKNAPSASSEEKRRMMDLLKRFEEDALDDSLLLDEDEDGDGIGDLQTRLKGMDIYSASYDQLWAALSPEERDKFTRAFKDPNSELAKRLLVAADAEKALVEPWWTTSLHSNQDALTNANGEGQKTGERPQIMEIPPSLVKRSPGAPMSGPLLLYNICAVGIAYVYAVRHFAVSPICSLPPIDPDRVEVKRTISQVVPFLIDKRSTTVLTSLSAVVTDLWSRFPANQVNQRVFAALLQDVATLVRPSAVIVVDGAPDKLEHHPNANLLCVLSDLAELFDPVIKPKSNSSSTTSGTPKPNHVRHKLTFYAAYILGTPPPTLRMLADEAAMQAKMMEVEHTRQNQTSIQEERSTKRGTALAPSRPSIEEL